MSYLYILGSAGCSVLIAHLLKTTEVKALRTLPTLTVNYLFAGTLALLLGMQSTTHAAVIISKPWILLFCLGVGALFIGNFILYSKSVDVNGVGVTIAAMRVSLLVPVLVSLYLYRESITLATSAGIVLVLGALLLLIPRKKNITIAGVHAGWLLLFIFLISGFADASLKIYEEDIRGHFNELIFMGLVFLSAFLIGISAMMIRKAEMIKPKEIAMGCLIGVPNLYSSVFLIYALTDIDGAIAYPMVNVLNVAAGTALGYWFWKDEITGWQWLGLTITVIALILLL